MPSAHDLIQHGFKTRLACFQEKVQLRGVWWNASINRMNMADRLPGEVQLNPDEGATIVIEIEAPEPRAGEVLTDNSDRKHRIGEVKMVKHGWFCRCQTEP